jgi:hypothetical protein
MSLKELIRQPLKVLIRFMEQAPQQIVDTVQSCASAFYRRDKRELPLSSDDLTHTHSITRRLLVTKCLARRMLKNDFSTDFLSHLPG